MSSVEAAKHFGVPQSTIRNHKRQSRISIGSGQPYLLTKLDEDHLVQLFLDLEQTGFRLTKSKVMKIARNYVTPCSLNLLKIADQSRLIETIIVR